MNNTFTLEETVQLPVSRPNLGLTRGAIGRVVYVYTDQPSKADAEFFSRENGRFAIAVLTKDPELSVLAFYP